MARQKQSLQVVVGSHTYAAWVDMLRRLVPNGRTQRLAPLVAGMLHYATLLGYETTEDNAVVEALQAAAEADEPDESSQWLLPLIDRLLPMPALPTGARTRVVKGTASLTKSSTSIYTGTICPGKRELAHKQASG